MTGSSQVQDGPDGTHRNGCTGCEHEPEAFPQCWTDEQISDEYFRVRQLVTGDGASADYAASAGAPVSPVQATDRADSTVPGWDAMLGQATAVLNQAHSYLSTRDLAAAVLSAALAGRTVLELPEPNVYHADRRHDGPEYGWWPLDAHDVRAFLADGRGRVGSGKPYVRVHNSSGSVVFDAADATAIAAAILAAGPAAEGLASGSGVGDQHD